MKKLIFGCAIAMCGFIMPQTFAYDPCCCDEVGFNGFYLGGNLGVISNTAHRNDLDGFLTDNSGWSTIDTDVTAGVQIGYDWLCCNTLFGLVADWDWTNVERTLYDNPNADSTNYIRSEFDWFSTYRVRAGLAVCDALIYLTGGAVVGRFETTWNDDPNHFNSHNTRWGWVGGVGLEFLAWCDWSVGAEFLFLQFSERTRSFASSETTRFSFGHSDSAWVGRILLNYRLGDLCSCWCR